MPSNLLPPQKAIDLYFKVTVTMPYDTPILTVEERAAMKKSALESLTNADGTHYVIPVGAEHDSLVWQQY